MDPTTVQVVGIDPEVLNQAAQVLAAEITEHLYDAGNLNPLIQALAAEISTRLYPYLVMILGGLSALAVWVVWGGRAK